MPGFDREASDVSRKQSAVFGPVRAVRDQRKRRELHECDFDKFAVIPPFIYLGLSLLVMLLGLGIWGSWAALIVFMIALFWMLWKNAKLSPARACAYTLAVLIFNLAINT